MARLIAKTRNKLPGKVFAGPDRSYPIPDASHARNALARASQHAGPALKAKIRAKVHAKFPDIKQHDEGRAPMKMDGGAVHHRMDRAPRRK
jgi:hypothetical protein